MNVVDLPEHATRGLYDEAISRYAAMVKGRAVGVHRVGNVRYPGLSDIDLLVVTEHEGVDNRYFFSALQRLPQRFHRLFLHEPFILPAWSLRVMRSTTVPVTFVRRTPVPALFNGDTDVRELLQNTGSL